LAGSELHGGATAEDEVFPSMSAVFPHGIASFDPGPDRVILWTHVPAVTEVTWTVVERGPDGAPAGAPQSGVVEVDETDPFVSVDVTGLRPGTDHLYWFEAAGRRSRTGRTRTLPAGSPARWRAALTCCADHSINELTVYRSIAAADVDVVVHLGDYIYETKGKGQRRQDPDHACVTAEDYHRRYAQVRSDGAVLDLHARHPMITIWDDHDIADNAWRHGAKAHDDEEHGPWGQRLRAAAITRQKWLPARLTDPDDPLRLWRSFRVGDLAELVLTDTRIDGRDQQAGDPGARALDDPDRSLVGPTQRLWLEERIRDRSSRWCLLASQVAVSPMALPVPVDTTVLDGAPSGYGLVDGKAVCVDEWDGYPEERRHLARWLADRGGDAVILSGDVHSSWVFDGPLAPGVPPVAPEFVVPGVSSTPMGRQLPRGWRKVAARAFARAEGARWFELESWGFVTIEVTSSSVTGTWHFVDATGTDPTTSVGARWVLDHGTPGTLRAVGPLVEPPAPLRASHVVRPVLGAVAALAVLGALAARLARSRNVRKLAK
jgi:alkaline phosphatase D